MQSTVIIDDFRLSAGGVIIDEEQKMVCLIKDIQSNEYLLPKGGKKPFETLPETAEREVFEETGYENEIAPEQLLGIHFRPNSGGRPGEHKVIYWYYSKLTNRIHHEGTQEEDEHFCSVWLTLDQATEKLSFDDDKVVVRRGFQSLFGTEIESTVEHFQWCGLENNCIRLLSTSSTRVVNGFAVLDKKGILLSWDRVTKSWSLPTERCVKLSEILSRNLRSECAPFLFELELVAADVTVRQWYLLDIPDDDLQDTNIFDEDEALNKLKDDLYKVRVVKSAFRKFASCKDEN